MGKVVPGAERDLSQISNQCLDSWLLDLLSVASCLLSVNITKCQMNRNCLGSWFLILGT